MKLYLEQDIVACKDCHLTMIHHDFKTNTLEPICRVTSEKIDCTADNYRQQNCPLKTIGEIE